MNARLKSLMTAKVPGFVFILVCITLAGVAVAAKVLADDISSMSDCISQSTEEPAFHKSTV